jgi:hypothetical protein
MALFNSRSWTQGKGDRDVTILLRYWLHVIISISICIQTSSIDKATKHFMVQGGGCGTQNIQKTKTVCGFLQEGYYSSNRIQYSRFLVWDWSNFTNNCWGALDYTSLVGGLISTYITASNLKDLLPAHTHYELDWWCHYQIVKGTKSTEMAWNLLS